MLNSQVMLKRDNKMIKHTNDTNDPETMVIKHNTHIKYYTCIGSNMIREWLKKIKNTKKNKKTDKRPKKAKKR